MWRLLLCLIAGGLLPLAFAPIKAYPLAYFMPAVLLYFWLKASPRQAFWQGLLFGLGLFGVGSSWVYISVHNFGNATPFTAASLTALLIIIMGLYPAIQGYLLRKLWRNHSITLQCLCVFPAIWVILEYIRSFLCDGFPFLFLGYTQTNTLLGGFAPIIGVYGISLIITFISGALVLLTQAVGTSRKTVGAVIVMLLIGVGALLHHHLWTRPSHKALSLSLIQGNIPQSIKWNPNSLDSILRKYERLTQKHWQSDIIVWPEGAVPFFPNELPLFFSDMSLDAKKHHTTLVIGAPLKNSNTNQTYNGLILLGLSHGMYKKRHLVPFGEFTPLQSVFGRIMKKLNVPMADLSPGPKTQPMLLINGIPIAFYICYETAFPIEAMDEMQGKQLAINIVDDAWFGHSFAKAQQMQMTAMRALETGRYIAVTANTGITALVNPFGKLIKTFPVDQTGVLTVHATPMSGKTPLMKNNYYPLVFIIMIMLLVSFLHRVVVRANNDEQF